MALVPRDSNVHVQPACPEPAGNVQVVDPEAQDFIKQLEFAVIAGQRLSESIGPAYIVAQRIQRELDEIKLAASKKEQTDPEIQVELAELEQGLQSCIRKAKNFLRACVTMAEYGIREDVFAAINQELSEQGKLTKLNAFIQHIIEELAVCTECYSEFDIEYKAVKQCATEKMEKYKRRVSATNLEQVTARRRFANALLGSRLALGIKQISGIVFATSFLFAGLGITSHRMLGVFSALGVAGLIGSSAFEYYTTGVSIAERETVTDRLDEREIFTKALESVSQLQTSMFKVKEEIEEMRNHANQVHSQIKRIKNHSVAQLEDLEYINQLLLNLRSHFNAILEQLGPGGSKISTKRDEVVSNTVSEQPSDTADVTPNTRNPLDYHSSRRESISSYQAMEDSERDLAPGIEETNGHNLGVIAVSVNPASPTSSVASYSGHNGTVILNEVPVAEQLSTDDTRNTEQETEDKKTEKDYVDL